MNNYYDQNGKPVVFTRGEKSTSVSRRESVSPREVDSLNRKQDIVVVHTCDGTAVVSGIKATAILAKYNLGDYENLLWPTTRCKKDIIVFFNEVTLKSYFRTGKGAQKIRDSGLPDGTQLEFSYFRKTAKK